MGTAVVGRSDRSETFLAGGIPDLKLHSLAIELNGSDFKVNADGGDITFGISVISET